MYHSNNSPQHERVARSKLKKIIYSSPFIKGSLATHARKCGKPNCKCSSGEKHVSLYLAYWEDNKQKRIFIPTHLEETIKKWVETNKTIEDLLSKISRACYKRFTDKKTKAKA